jgi:pimeloyl-ACP methyl ester carboxylesterase
VSGPSLKQEIHFCKAADGAQIAYSVMGSGPPLIKAANWLSHLEYDLESPVWRHWLMELSRDHTLIRYDERGCGLSDWDVAQNNFDTWVADLEAVADAAGFERFSMIGISQGGPVAIRYAVRHSARVSSLVLYGTYARGWRMRGRSASEISEREALITLSEAGWGRDVPVYRDVFTKTFVPDASEEQRQWFNELQRKTCSPANAVALQKALGPIDVTGDLDRVRVPTLVLHARGDLRCPLDEGRLVAAGIPGSRFVLLESQNHILLEHEQAWPVFLREVRSFLGVDPTPSSQTAGLSQTSFKERRVVQWALAYLTVAWVLLQLIGEIQDPWSLPDWTVRAAQVTLLAGFIITVVTSWTLGARRKVR